MKFSCENLEVYQLSQKLVPLIYTLTKSFPADEKFGLTSQIKRSAISITLNIAEGSGKWSKNDFANFIRISIGSLIETDTSLKIALDLNFIDQSQLQDIDPIIEKLYFKLIALHKSLNNTKN